MSKHPQRRPPACLPLGRLSTTHRRLQANPITGSFSPPLCASKELHYLAAHSRTLESQNTKQEVPEVDNLTEEHLSELLCWCSVMLFQIALQKGASTGGTVAALGCRHVHKCDWRCRRCKTSAGIEAWPLQAFCNEIHTKCSAALPTPDCR